MQSGSHARWISREVSYVRWVSHKVDHTRWVMQGGLHEVGLM